MGRAELAHETRKRTIHRYLMNARSLFLLKKASFDRVGSKSLRTMQIQFLHEVGTVFFHRFDTDAKIPRNLLVLASFRDKF
jgi:hypothetical protein